jgi:hypothetical protein
MARRSSRRLKKNSERPRGFPWPRERRLYHATVALDTVLDEGVLKSRAELDKEIHATGGGPDNAISFTLSIDVARAICLGLRTLARCAQGDMLLGDLIIAMERIAPQATAWKLADMRLSPERVDRTDRNLFPVYSGFGGEGTSVKMETLLERIERNSGDFEGVAFRTSEGARSPYFVSAWTSRPVLLSMLTGRYSNPPSEHYRADLCFDFYKGVLGMGDMSFREVYDPLFFLTTPSGMRGVDVDQIGIVDCRLDARWLCTDGASAEAMGFDTTGLWLSDWSATCEQSLQFPGKQTKPPTAAWDSPDRSDTISYLGPHMAEVRAYDSALVTKLDQSESFGATEAAAEREWRRRGVDTEEPVAWPYFVPGTPYIAT